MSDLAALRDEFPVTRSLVYLDIANKAVPPRCVARAAEAFFAAACRDGGATSFSLDRVEDVRASAARLLGAAPGEVAFVKNTSEGLNIAIHALGLEAGDRVVTTDLEHANALFALQNLEAAGVEVARVPIGPRAVALDQVVPLIDARTRAIVVSHVTWAAGVRMDLAALAGICRPRGIRLIVDAVQAVGVLDVDVRQLGVDLLACGGHKALLAVTGTGLLYCRRELVPELRPAYAARASMVPGASPAGPPRFGEDARRFEIGNANHLGIHLLGAALGLLERVGMPRIEARVRELTTYLIDGLERAGRPVRTPRPWAHRAGIVAFEVDDAVATAARLRRDGVVLSARDGALRASPHVYNTEAELDELLSRL